MAGIIVYNIISEKEHDTKKVIMIHFLCLIPNIIETHCWCILRCQKSKLPRENGTMTNITIYHVLDA